MRLLAIVQDSENDFSRYRRSPPSINDARAIAVLEEMLQE